MIISRTIISTLLICLISSWMLGCTSNKYHKELLTVDSLASVNPDSALVLLDSLKDIMGEDNCEKDQMYYELLMMKASDKAGCLEPDKSKADSILHYYEHGGDKRLLPTAYYYAGRTYYELHDAPQALYYFQKAADVVENDWELKGCIYSNIGYIFMYQGLFDEAYDAFYRQYLTALDAHDSLSAVYSLRDMALSLDSNGKNQEAISYIQQSYQLASKIQDKYMMRMTMLSSANLYKHIGDLNSAEEYARKASDVISPIDSSVVYSTLASIYKWKGAYDSVIVYSQKMEQVGNIYAKDSASKFLTEVYLRRNEMDKAAQYMHKFLVYDDSVRSVSQVEATARVNTLYNYQLREEENLRLEKDNAQKKDIIIIVGLIALLLGLGMVIGVIYHRMKQREKSEQILRYQRAEILKNEVLRQSEEQIELNKNEILSLREQISHIQNDNQTTIQEFEKKIERLSSANAIAELEIKRRRQSEENIKLSSIYYHFCQLGDANSKSKLREKDWKSLETLLDQEFDQFTMRLKGVGNLSELEYRMSLLIKLGIKPMIMSRLLFTSKENVTSVRSRVYKKIFGVKASPDQWDDFIRKL